FFFSKHFSDIGTNGIDLLAFAPRKLHHRFHKLPREPLPAMFLVHEGMENGDLFPFIPENYFPDSVIITRAEIKTVVFPFYFHFDILPSEFDVRDDGFSKEIEQSKTCDGAQMGENNEQENDLVFIFHVLPAKINL